MTTMAETTSKYERLFIRRRENERRSVPGWLTAVQGNALDRFMRQGFPTVRDEEWKYTNLADLANTDFVLADPDVIRITPQQIEPYRLGPEREILLVFVNGFFAEHLSDTRGLPDGVAVWSLADALAGKRSIVEDHFERYNHDGYSALVDLNTAFTENGAVVDVAAGALVETPIHLLFVSCMGDSPIMAHPRVVIVANDNSQVGVIEQYVALGEQDVYFNNVVTDLRAADGVVADHCKVIREADRANHIGTLQLSLGRSSTVSSQTICLGGGLVRNDINPLIEGEGADCNMDGLYMLGGKQHADNHLRVEHRQPHTSSRELFRGILDDHGRGVFSGRIIVRPGAQKTDAKQTNMNLLLSPHAKVDTKPQLEIFADDVKCTHGATIGQIDPDAVFYLRTRGLSEDAARSLLIYAFAREGLARVSDERLRAKLDNIVLSRLSHGELLREMA